MTDQELKTEQTRAAELIDAHTKRALMMDDEQRLQAKLEEFPLYKDYMTARAERLHKDKEIKQLEAEYEGWAVQQASLGLRNSFSVGQLKTVQVFDYPEKQAIDWLVERGLSAMLKIADQTAFQKVIVALGEGKPPWVTISEMRKMYFDRKQISLTVEARMEQLKGGDE